MGIRNRREATCAEQDVKREGIERAGARDEFKTRTGNEGPVVSSLKFRIRQVFGQRLNS